MHILDRYHLTKEALPGLRNSDLKIRLKKDCPFLGQDSQGSLQCQDQKPTPGRSEMTCMYLCCVVVVPVMCHVLGM